MYWLALVHNGGNMASVGHRKPHEMIKSNNFKNIRDGK
jgi:hypothetical protein